MFRLGSIDWDFRQKKLFVFSFLFGVSSIYKWKTLYNDFFVFCFKAIQQFNILSQAVEIKQKLIPFNHFIHLISRTRIERIQHLLAIKDKTNQHQDA